MNDESTTPRFTTQSSWLILLLIMFILGYWIFARYLERIDVPTTTPDWWRLILQRDMPPSFTLVLEFFHWRVLRHFIPLLVGVWLAYQAAVGLLWVMYDLPDRPAAAAFLSRLAYSDTAVIMTPINLRSQSFAESRQKHPLLHIGGPGWVRVEIGNVAVTEWNGRFYRILGAGAHKLERFETVYAVLDLRPQERTATQIPLMTQDGIPLTANLAVHFRLASANQTQSINDPFPFDTTAVRTAAYSQIVPADGQVAPWDTAPLGAARGILTNIIAKYPLDKILAPTQSDVEPLLTIRNELFFQVREAMLQKGIDVSQVQISQLELRPDVSQQYIKYWQSFSETDMRLSRVEGEAAALEMMEMAQAEAEMNMIHAILEGVQHARYSHNAANIRDVVALRLVEALEKMARHSQQVAPLPQNLLTQIDTLRLQLSNGEDEASQPDKNF